MAPVALGELRAPLAPVRGPGTAAAPAGTGAAGGAAGVAPPRLPARAAATNQKRASKGRGFRAERAADWLSDAAPTA